MDRPILFTGVCICCFLVLCILVPQWIGFPSLVILGFVIVFLAVQVFRFPRILVKGASLQAVIGTCIIQVDEYNQPLASFQLIPSQQMERIPLHSGEKLTLELTLLQSEPFYPLYGGGGWVVVHTCRSGAAELSFSTAQSNVLVNASASATFVTRLLGFQVVKKELFINLEDAGTNIKQQIEWVHESLLLRPL
ncbi:hypothetical protein [Gracilinema caldarium]|uniref:hypothetical protein n=1 Tax=Gracilinema caldarium TaxID=215591 RepID=UPI0012EA663F|nr:hypothetical protein [Gracilinema caldarium]